MLASKKHFSIVKMVEFAILAALVIVLQITIGGALQIGGLSINVVLIPITLGAMILGPISGACLGFICGLIIFVMGATGIEPFTFFLFSAHPFITAAICFVKTTLGGFLAGLLFKVIKKANSLVASFVAAAIVPIVNTGIFVLGCLTMTETIGELSAQYAPGQSVIYYIFIGLAGINFIVEFFVNLILSPALHRVEMVVSKKLQK